jgi:putative transposase
MVIEQVRNGRRVADVAASVEVPEATVFRWIRQDKMDRGEIAGASSQEASELRAAKRRIAELEAELATGERASELCAEGQVVRPKVLCPIVETLARQGHGTKRACRMIGVPSTTFYYWRNPLVTARATRRAWLTDVIRQIHAASRETYGMRRIKAEFADAYGHRANRKLITSIKRQGGIAGLSATRRRRPNLARRPTTEDLVNGDFTREGPNQLWMTVITEYPTRGGRLFCCVVLDAWSRRVVGWSIDRRPTAAMVNSALGIAIEARNRPNDTLVHSDSGTAGASRSCGP